MFDVDGTLVQSFGFDEECYLDAVTRVLGHSIDDDWSKYPHVTDVGILDHHLSQLGRRDEREQVGKKVKSIFIDNIKIHLSRSPVQQVRGAAGFIAYLRELPNVSMSIATGGWRETAQMKLESAGIDISDIPLASSNDHYSRIEIMKLAMQKASVSTSCKLIYFGDAAWDKQACEELQCDFVLVGKRIEHDKVIRDFSSIEQACLLIDL